MLLDMLPYFLQHHDNATLSILYTIADAEMCFTLSTILSARVKAWFYAIDNDIGLQAIL